MSTPRMADVPVDGLFLDRWSPRAFDPGFVLSDADLLPLFEAARWAPSAFNWQPWRFAVALRQNPRWADFVDLLMPFNAGWAQHASALIFVSSEKHIKLPMAAELSLSHSHSFDTGAACALLALQARRVGLHVHAMTGIHVDRIPRRLGLPETRRVEAALAVGRIGDPASLPERLREREAPNGRKQAHEFVTQASVHD